jgi:chemotaxis signal transduction protein
MATNDQNNANAARTLFVMRAGARLFAVFAEEVEATASDLTPTPLPFAPHAVLGVVSLRGRIRTVIDPIRLTDADSNAATHAASSDSVSPGSDPSPLSQPPARLFVAFTGDEQLALACDGAEGLIEVAHAKLNASPDADSHVLGTIEHRGLTVTLLDPARLFDAAVRGIERRRKRT